jgi:molybdenum cofactor cytidylyltransferase
MLFGRLEIDKAEGAILGYSVVYSNGVAKKGQIIDMALIEDLRSDGIDTIYAGRPSRQDILEDSVAQRVAERLCGDHALLTMATTGRINVLAERAGLLVLDVDAIHEFNRVHEGLTIATKRPYCKVAEGEIVATIKVIPFAIPADVLERALTICDVNRPPLEIAPFVQMDVGLILTKNPWTKKSLMLKSEQVLDDRVTELGSRIVRTIVTRHDEESVSKAITDLRQNKLSPILILGSSAIADRYDVIPAALSLAGGEVEHVGMPVDPGNLLMFGRLDETPVIGVPTCARSPNLNGFDWVLERILADQNLTSEDIMTMGVGGLLK